MATLEQIGFTLLTGSCILIISFTLFGIAVRNQNTFIAPRAEARPRSVIFRPRAHPATGTLKDKNTNSSGSSNIPQWLQICFDSTFGWISWTLELSYDTMLHGVPGTGTRQDGITGSLLTVNLDGIVLLRFTAMCLRVCCLAAVLFVFFGIPIYLSAQCYSDQDTILTTNSTSNDTGNVFATIATAETSPPTTVSSTTCDSN